MRADRLLSLLMLLQTRGQMSARALAAELGTSVRTIYRDVEALSMAGIPVYAERGRGGGIALLDSFKTNLTGLTPDEVRALFALSIPQPLADLGLDHELKAALLKLSAALPVPRRPDESHTRQRLHLDSRWWFQSAEPVPHLPTLQRAVWEDRRLRITYRQPYPVDEVVQRVVAPYGLVAKAGAWYLVVHHAGRFRVYRATGLLDAQITGETFERRAGFDLAAFWDAWSAGYERERPSYPVTVRAAPGLVALLPLHFGEPIRARIAAAAPPDADGWLTLTLPFDNLESARDRLLGFGRAVEVLEPLALRLSIIDYAQQIAAFYAARPTTRAASH